MNRTKKLSTVVLLAAGIFTTGLFTTDVVAEASVTYKDVSNKHWAHSTIQEATNLGFFKGDGYGYFHPDKEVTRAEFASILARIFEVDSRVDEPFTDVSDTHWANDAIEELLALNIISVNDYASKRFEPTKAMTRAELSKWLTNALSVKQPSYKAIMKTIRDSQHTLLPTTEFLRGGINKVDQGNIGVMLGTGLFAGYTDGSFKPAGTTSRSEVAALSIRFRNMEDKAPTEFRGLNELVEVAETATNMLSATEFEYSTFKDESNVKNIIDKPLTLNNNVGTAKIKRLIFVEGHKTVQEMYNNSIYAKMFVAENATNFYEESVYLFVEQTLVPNKELDHTALGYSSFNGYITAQRLSDNTAKYNLVSFTADPLRYFFTVGQEKRYWTKAYPFEKDSYNYPVYQVNDGTTLRIYSTY